MRIDDIDALLATVQFSSLNQAAEYLGITQSAITRRLQQPVWPAPRMPGLRMMLRMMRKPAQAAGLEAEATNRAMIMAMAWANEVGELGGSDAL